MAGTEVRSLYYDLNIDDSNLKKQLDDADKSVKGFGDKLGAAWGKSVEASKTLLLGFTALGAGAVAFGVSAVKSFQESQNVMAQTEAVLKSTGNAAGVTAEQVTKLASALERQTKFSDEDIQSAENLLLTFTSISKDIFPDATKIVLDMSQALGQDLKSSSIQLGKALQDPIVGVTALRRVGVNFSEAQQQVIADLVNTGQKAKAQALIMKELQTEFGGSAEAAGNTFAGQLAKLNNQFDNVKEAIGGMLAQVAVPFLTALMDWFNGIGGVEGVMDLLRRTFDKVKPYFPIIAGAIMGALLPAFIALGVSIWTALAPLLPFIAAGAALGLLLSKLGIGFDDIAKFAGGVVDKLKEVWKWFTDLNPALQFLLFPLGAIISNFSMIWGWAQQLAQLFMTYLWPSLVTLGNTIMQNLWPALQQLWDAVVRLWNALQPALLDALKIVGAIIGAVLIGVLWLLVNVINVLVQVFSFLISVVSNVINWVANLISWFGNAIGAVINLVATIGGWFGRLPTYVRDAINGVVNWFKSLPGMITSAIGNVGSLLYNAGKDLIQGMINGITDTFKKLANAVKDAVGGAVNAVKGFLGIKSPSKVFIEIGNNVTDGFVKGINDSSDRAMAAMDAMTGAIIAPTMNVSQNVQQAAPATRTPNVFSFTGDINLGDASAVEAFFNKFDRNTYLETIGVSPQ